MQAELEKLSLGRSAPGSTAAERGADRGPLFVPVVLRMSLPDQALLAEEWLARQQVSCFCMSLLEGTASGFWQWRQQLDD